MADLTSPLGNDVTPIVFVVSDSTGETASTVVEAAADQFVDGVVIIRKLTNLKSVHMLADYLDKYLEEGVPTAVFHTIVDKAFRNDLKRELAERGVPSIDLIGPAMSIIERMSNQEPKYQVGNRTTVTVENVEPQA